MSMIQSVRIARVLALLSLSAGAVVLMASRPAQASFHLFQINELYSNASGTVQFVELKEAFGANGENFLSGHTLTFTQGGTTHTFTFPNDLPSTNTANANVLIGTSSFAGLGVVMPDYVIPDGFLLTNGGTVDYAGVDSVTYASLPTDGVTSINRNGVTGVNSPTNFAGQTGSITPTPPFPPPPLPGPSAIPVLSDWGLGVLTIALLAAALLSRLRIAPGRNAGPRQK